ncbi:similar to Saccharomyces cerevisiae YDL021W GPM2 Homolog of Gpm1p phosphoglycerate mutase, which converts 3-phosphoglycerate to 2-phosphoglycerate in glycolysis [Maudiozyma barnettii]|uniref:Phosphoglycerate mutase n=1 Tax=Maudiozyma barnettii TaxID=61262 RepID=A0A8H2VKS9_9SACH|nr:uncharacterized protein KABA2_13S05126 [Kazachstania barnettii]CAB4257191.1 similar to Saccharomyces cerevisiae YDL021W GPM2 Homolog of Gpm1p phosphoglycerate mutase, which converts 3-phosphoglycerate to 2-phosphoglycerate in glycolysis [Kazachstania barnettii]CAD1779561.1 similar to Saccharomyces cerevisiae YDL021W GPM2 Homolog of Gpm1p phosphoglycerate mutase, which converts 3-phosphoglycerate to 2-phosphoglycerate in glycolysis [Kazachstania barnettii]
MTSQQETFKIFVLRHGQSELNHENIFCGWIDAKLTEKGKQQARNSAQLIKQYCEANEETLPQIGYTSRLVRTQQTMEVIMDELALKGNFSVISGDVHALKKIELPQEALVKGQLPVLQTWRLNERHYGAWQGQRKPNVLKDVGDEEYMRIRRDYRGKPPLVDLSLEMVQPNEKGAATGYEFKEPNRTVKYATEDAAGETLPISESLAEVVTRIRPFYDGIVLRAAKEYNLNSCIIVGHGSSVRSLLKIIEDITDQDIKNVDIPNGIPLVIEFDKSDLSFIKSFYLDPESAKINAAKVRKEGFEKNP